MDARRSFYLAPGQDDLADLAPDVTCLGYHGVTYTVAGNDNIRVKDRLSARCGALLRHLLDLRRFSGRTSKP